MAKQQTFIILCWYGAETYEEALKREDKVDENGKKVCERDFFRVSVKRVETAKKYLANWRKQAIDKGWTTLYAVLTRNDAQYEIRATPDGYHEEGVASKGWMNEFDEQLSKAA